MRYCPNCRKTANTYVNHVKIGPIGYVINVLCEECGNLIEAYACRTAAEFKKKMKEIK
jgi:predicted Zn finger-like uncharacterized protein